MRCGLVRPAFVTVAVQACGREFFPAVGAAGQAVAMRRWADASSHFGFPERSRTFGSGRRRLFDRRMVLLLLC